MHTRTDEELMQWCGRIAEELREMDTEVRMYLAERAQKNAVAEMLDRYAENLYH